MQTNTLSFQFQYVMFFVAVVFWLLNWIPFVNIITNAIYWAIWLGVFIYKYLPLLKSITKTGISIGTIGLKIGIITSVALVLGEIPLISIIPWNVMATHWVNRLIKELLSEVGKIKKDAEELKGGWQKHWQEYRVKNIQRPERNTEENNVEKRSLNT